MKIKIILSFLVLFYFGASTLSFSQQKIFNSVRDQAEVVISINPTNSSNLIAVAISTISPVYHKIGYYYSFNGGTTWIGDESSFGSVSEADPVIKFDPDGLAYVLIQKSLDRGFYMRKSTDGGINWLPALSQEANKIWIEEGEQGNDGVDRPWMAISSIRNANGYFDIFISYTWREKDENGVLVSTHASLLKSVDGGLTFSKIKTFGGTSTIYRTGTFVEVDPDGDIFFAFSKQDLNNNFAVYETIVTRSTNGGTNYSDSKIISVIQSGSYHVDYAIKQNTVRLDSYARISIDQGPLNRGKVYVTWASKSTSGGSVPSDIKFISGVKSGSNFIWDVNPKNIDATADEQWMPAINTSPDGLLSIFYYSSGQIATDPIYTYVRYSTDGGTTFTPRVSIGNQFVLPQTGRRFLGDYHGINSWFGNLYAVWSEYHSDQTYGDIQIYFKKINSEEINISGYNKVEVDQTDQSGSTFGKFGRWNQGLFTEYTAPHDFLFEVNSDEVIRANQEFKPSTYQKYHDWNIGNDVVNHNIFNILQNTVRISSQFSVTNEGVTITNYFLDAPLLNPGTDEIDFRDPWFIDYQDPSYGNNLRNRGMDLALWRSRLSPFNPDYDEPYEFSQPYLGVFLNQDPVQTPTFYKVRSAITQDVSLPQTGKTHKFYFQDWSSSGTDPLTQNNIVSGYYETPVVFRSEPATVTANLKGTQLSNDAETYKNNSQRKFVKSPAGNMYMTYESMGYIWMEKSTNNGVDWTILNDGKPISGINAQLPSMDYYPLNDDVLIVWQEGYTLYYAVYHGTSDTFRIDEVELVNPPPEGQMSTNANPVVAWGYNNKALFIWETTENLSYSVANITVLSTTWKTSGNIGFNPNYNNPTLYINNDNFYSNDIIYHLAYQVSTNSIEYRKLSYNQSANSLGKGDAEPVSLGSGYTLNYSPTITAWKVVSSEEVKLAWIGYRSADVESPQGGGGGVPTYEQKVLFKGRSGLGAWSSLYVFGDNVNSVNINNTSGIQFAFAWSQTSGADSYVNKYVRSGESPPVTRTLNTTGKYVQVNNGTNFYDMFASSFSITSSPYFFANSQAFTEGLSKPNGIKIYSGREGVVNKDGADFYFAVGDIVLNDEVMGFVEIEDTVIINNQTQLNTYLISEPISVNNNSALTYGVQYGITDSMNAVTALSDGTNINFKVQLEDANSGEVLGIFDDITYDEDNVALYASIGYSVDLNGIGNREVVLRLIVNSNYNCDYFLSKRFAEADQLEKSSYVEVLYNGNLSVFEYALEQNYPNPFNPSTTIKYQIPESGTVTLKIFDVLGSEVTTLVNAEQNEGRYEVQFNASNFASGVYIYRLQVNDYLSIKKMVLLK